MSSKGNIVKFPKEMTARTRIIVLCILVSFSFSNLGCKSFFIRQPMLDVRLKMVSMPKNTGSCLTSLFGAPTKGCIEWQPNVNAAPTFEPARGLIFVGAGDSFLHVLDAHKGDPVAQIATEGRVITDTVLSPDRTLLYVGTEKGVVHALDAFTFEAQFFFRADGKINNNLTTIGSDLVFTSAIGTIYRVEGKTGRLMWQIKQPLASERLRIVSNSNIFLYDKMESEGKEIELLVPHADGYISIIDPGVGEVKRTIVLGVGRASGFPDIVAPMTVIKNQLWVASYDLGLFSLDLGSWQIREHIDIYQIVQMVSHGRTLFVATPGSLFAISDMGSVLWENKVNEIKTGLMPLGYPFVDALKGRRQLFFGTPSRLLIHEGYNAVIMATRAGSLGVFDKSTGELRRILGNLVGFGPNINGAETDSFVTMSTRGLLMKFQFNGYDAAMKRMPNVLWNE